MAVVEMADAVIDPWTMMVYTRDCQLPDWTSESACVTHAKYTSSGIRYKQSWIEGKHIPTYYTACSGGSEEVCTFGTSDSSGEPP